MSKKAEVSIKSTRTAQQIMADDQPKPLDVMIKNMRWADEQADYYERRAAEISPEKVSIRGRGGKKKKDKAEADKLWYQTMAAKYRALAMHSAEASAPYMHARIQSISMKHTNTVPTVLRLIGPDAKL